MNKNSWLKHKDRLNRKYDQINVTMKNLTIRKIRNQYVASFIQRYESSGHNAIGKKELILKKEEGQWKIYRETWKKI